MYVWVLQSGTPWHFTCSCIWCQYFSPWRGNRFTSNSSFLAAKPVCRSRDRNCQEMETVKQTYQCSFVPRPCLVCDSFQDTWGLGMRLCYDTIAKGNELFTPRKKINLHKNLINPKPYSACFDHNECLLFQHVVLRKLFTYQTLV